MYESLREHRIKESNGELLLMDIFLKVFTRIQTIISRSEKYLRGKNSYYTPFNKI